MKFTRFGDPLEKHCARSKHHRFSLDPTNGGLNLRAFVELLASKEACEAEIH